MSHHNNNNGATSAIPTVTSSSDHSIITTHIISINGFLEYVFRFDDATKSDILNIIQYALIATVPIISLNKACSYLPEADPAKSNIELMFEVVGQLIILFVGLFFINRFISFFPTYSHEPYPNINVISIITVALMFMFTFQTKLGEKIAILVERFGDGYEFYMGSNCNKKQKKKKVVCSGGGGGGDGYGQGGGQSGHQQGGPGAMMPLPSYVQGGGQSGIYQDAFASHQQVQMAPMQYGRGAGGGGGGGGGGNDGFGDSAPITSVSFIQPANEILGSTF